MLVSRIHYIKISSNNDNLTMGESMKDSKNKYLQGLSHKNVIPQMSICLHRLKLLKQRGQ